MSTQTAKLTTWELDAAHTLVEFAVKHMMFATVKGRFSDVAGRIHVNERNPADSSVEVTIGTASIATGQEQRDAHLRSPDFFDAEKYPSITFRSTSIEALGGKRYRVTGDLTIRDVTRQVVMEAEETGRGKDPFGNFKIGFSAKTSVDRKDFGLTWNAALETGGVLVGDEIRIHLEVEANRVDA